MLDNELIVVCRIDPDTRKPTYEFKGRWTGRWLKLAMAKMPLAYRIAMTQILKDLKKEEEELTLKEKLKAAEKAPADIGFIDVSFKGENPNEINKESENERQKPNEPSESIRSTSVQRSGPETKRDGKFKAGKRKTEARQ